MREQLDINEDESAGVLHDRLMELGKGTVLKSLKLIETGKAETTVQKETDDIKTAYKLNRDNCKIDWTKPGKDIYNLVRGLSPYPGAWCLIKDNDEEWNVKLYETVFEEEAHSEKPGSIKTTKKDFKVAVKDSFVIIKTIQFPGKKKMSAQELLNGMQFSYKAVAL